MIIKCYFSIVSLIYFSFENLSQCLKKLVYMKTQQSKSVQMKFEFFNIIILFQWIKPSICVMLKKSISKLMSINIKSILKLSSKDSVWMQPSLQKIHKNASILSDHILALNLLEKTFNKPQLLSKPMSKPDLKTLSQKPNIKKRISKREQNKWNMKPKKNGKKENNKSKMLSINNQESLIMSLPPFQKVGKRSNKSHMKFMKLQHKKYMKWQLHQLSKKHIKQNKTLNKEQET